VAGLLIIACGALAKEVAALVAANRWQHVKVACLPADLHNRPKLIPGAVGDAIRRGRADGFERILVAYADCGTGGELDRVVASEGVERLPGAHCYELYSGSEVFTALADAEPGTFYLTDFLARHFERLVVRELGLDRHPELTAMYFGNYRRLVFLSQRDEPALLERARAAARRLGLAFAHRHTAYGELETRLVRFAERC
jgi:hypothetical protein